MFVLLDSKKTRFLLSTFFALKVNGGNAESFSCACTELPLAKTTPPNSVAYFEPRHEKLSFDPRAHTKTVGCGCAVALALWGWVQENHGARWPPAQLQVQWEIVSQGNKLKSGTEEHLRSSTSSRLYILS